MSLDGFDTPLSSEPRSGDVVAAADADEDISTTNSRASTLEDSHTTSQRSATANFDPEPTSVFSLTAAAASDDALLFSSLSPSLFAHDTWRNLSVIFESSESTNSLPERTLSNQDAQIAQTIGIEAKTEETTTQSTAAVGKRYSFPSIASLAPRLGKLGEFSPPKATNVAEKIAYFESSSRANTGPPLRSNLSSKSPPSRLSLPSTINRSSSHSNLGPNPSIYSSYRDTTCLGEKLQVGLIWFLDPHSTSSLQWVRCKATLYRSVLHLIWHIPETGRYMVQLDLLNCIDARSTPTLSHPSMAEDVGATTWLAGNIQGHVVEDDIFPIQLVYKDGIERLGTNSLRERLSWVSGIWNAINANSVNISRPNVSKEPPTIARSTSTNFYASSLLVTVTPPPVIKEVEPARHKGHIRSRSTDDIAMSAQPQRSSHILNRNISYPGQDTSVRREPLEPLKSTSSAPSTPSSTPRIRTVSLKSISSLFSGRTPRHEESHYLGSPRSTTSESPRRAASLSENAPPIDSLHHSSTEGEKPISVASIQPLRPSRLRKPKPGLPRTSALGLELPKQRSFSDSSVPTLVTTTRTDISLSTSQTTHYTSQQSTSSGAAPPTYHTALESSFSEIASTPVVSVNAPPAESLVDSRGPQEGDIAPASVISEGAMFSDAAMAGTSDATLGSGIAISFQPPSSLSHSSPSRSTHSTSSDVADMRMKGNIDRVSTLAASSLSSNSQSGTHNHSSSVLFLPSRESRSNPSHVTDDAKSSASSVVPFVDTMGESPSGANSLFPISPSPGIPFPRIISRHGSTTGSSTCLQDLMSQLDADEQSSQVSYPLDCANSGSSENVHTEVPKVPDTEVPMIQIPQPASILKSERRGFKLVPKVQRYPLRSDITNSIPSSIMLPSEIVYTSSVTPELPSPNVSDTPMQSSFRSSAGGPESRRASHEKFSSPSIADPLKDQSIGCQERLAVLMDFAKHTQEYQTRSTDDILRHLHSIEQHLHQLENVVRRIVVQPPIEVNERTLLTPTIPLRYTLFPELQPGRTLTAPVTTAASTWTQTSSYLADSAEIEDTSVLTDSIDTPSFPPRRSEPSSNPEIISNLDIALFPDPPGIRADSIRRTLSADAAMSQTSQPMPNRALLDHEVRLLLGEVGNLREHKRNLQYEMDLLMDLRRRIKLGGEFDPDWETFRQEHYTPMTQTNGTPEFAEVPSRAFTPSTSQSTRVENNGSWVSGGDMHFRPISSSYIGAFSTNQSVPPAFVARAPKYLRNGSRPSVLESAPRLPASYGPQLQPSDDPRDGKRL